MKVFAFHFNACLWRYGLKQNRLYMLKTGIYLNKKNKCRKMLFWRITPKNQKFELRFEVLESFQVRPEPIHGSPGPYTLKKKFQKILDFDFPWLGL